MLFGLFNTRLLAVTAYDQELTVANTFRLPLELMPTSSS